MGSPGKPTVTSVVLEPLLRSEAVAAGGTRLSVEVDDQITCHLEFTIPAVDRNAWRFTRGIKHMEVRENEPLVVVDQRARSEVVCRIAVDWLDSPNGRGKASQVGREGQHVVMP